MHKLPVLGQDNKIHCCSVDNNNVSCCEQNMTVKQVNPDFFCLQNAIIWCYECSYLLEKQDEEK